MASVFLLFNIGGGELLLIVLLILMFFGSDKIPEIARGLGKGIRTVRNAANDVKREITESAAGDENIQELKDTFDEGKKNLNEIAGTIKRKTGI